MHATRQGGVSFVSVGSGRDSELLRETSHADGFLLFLSGKLPFDERHGWICRLALWPPISVPHFFCVRLLSVRMTTCIS